MGYLDDPFGGKPGISRYKPVQGYVRPPTVKQPTTGPGPGIAKPSVFNALARPGQQAAPQQGAAYDPWEELLWSMLNGGGSGGGGGGGGYGYVAPDITPIIDQYNQSDAALAALFSKAVGNIRGDSETIGKTYDAATAGVTGSADQAKSTIAGAYQSSRDAQTQQLAALGIGDAAAYLAGQGGRAAADQAHSISNVEGTRNTNQGQLDSNRATALTYNTAIGNATEQQGTSAREMLTKDKDAAVQRAYDMAAQASYGGGGGGGGGGSSAGLTPYQALSLMLNREDNQREDAKLISSTQAAQAQAALAAQQQAIQNRIAWAGIQKPNTALPDWLM